MHGPEQPMRQVAYDENPSDFVFPERIQTLLKDASRFVPSDRFWCDNDGVVSYDQREVESPAGIFKLLHEYVHQQRGDRGDVSDRAYLEHEKMAWRGACELFQEIVGEYPASDLLREMDELIHACEEYMRVHSVCPSCGGQGVEFAPQYYSCPDCYADW